MFLWWILLANVLSQLYFIFLDFSTFFIFIVYPDDVWKPETLQINDLFPCSVLKWLLLLSSVFMYLLYSSLLSFLMLSSLLLLSIPLHSLPFFLLRLRFSTVIFFMVILSTVMFSTVYQLHILPSTVILFNISY